MHREDLPEATPRVCCSLLAMADSLELQFSMVDVRDATRQKRLKAALRENLKRRKQQLRGRAEGDVAGERASKDMQDDAGDGRESVIEDGKSSV